MQKKTETKDRLIVTVNRILWTLRELKKMALSERHSHVDSSIKNYRLVQIPCKKVEMVKTTLK